MLLRNLMLAIGVLALVTGAVVGVTWVYRGGGHSTASQASPQPVAVLAAAHAIPAGALLRETDLTWRHTGAGVVPVGGFPSGQATPGQLAGAVSRRAFSAGEALTQSGIVLPTQRGFLAAALAPGRRAVTITTDAAQSASGLVLPGDRVDVVLVQDLGSSAPDLAHKSVGETVLGDARVVAVDRKLPGAAAAPQAAETTAQAAPRTITLEATAEQAQRLFVASQLGKLEISLRALAQPVGDAAGRTAPTWAADVSPALHALSPAAKGANPSKPASRPAAVARRVLTSEPRQVIILRGAKAEAQ